MRASATIIGTYVAKIKRGPASNRRNVVHRADMARQVTNRRKSPKTNALDVAKYTP